MATYTELAAIQENAGWAAFFDQVVVACAKKAQAVIDSTTPGATVLEWAKDTISAPRMSAQDLVWYIVAKNSTASISAILGATENAIQNNINDAVDAVYGT